MNRQPKVEQPESFVRSGIEFVKRKGLKVVTIAALTSAALTGCASAGHATSPEKPVATTSASPTPEKTLQPENKFTGTVNYAAFEGFAEKDIDAQDAACAEFFNTNIIDKAIISKTSTGPEVAKWYADRVDLMGELNNDLSDPRNQLLAQNMIICMTSVHSNDQQSRNSLKSMFEIQATHRNEKIIRINPDGVTRYSNGVFLAQGELGAPYYAFSVEGHVNNFANTVNDAIYEWHDSKVFPSFKMTADVQLDSMESNGITPIVVDKMYANNPWH